MVFTPVHYKQKHELPCLAMLVTVYECLLILFIGSQEVHVFSGPLYRPTCFLQRSNPNIFAKCESKSSACQLLVL